MNLIIELEIVALLGLLCSIAWYVAQRQKLGAKRDAASFALAQKQGEIQMQSLMQMVEMNKINVERARREAAEHKEGEGWKES